MHHRLPNFRHLRAASSWAALTLAMAAAPALAFEKSMPVIDRVGVWFGGYNVDAEGDLSLSTLDGTQSTGQQRVIDGSDVVKRARVDWLLFDRQGFSVDLYHYSQNKSLGVSEPFTYNGQSYSATAQLNTKTSFDIGNFSYRWWFGGEDTVAGVGLGAEYNHTRIRVNYKTDDAVAKLDLKLNGPALYLRMRF